MLDDPRVDELLEKVLDSGSTPEEVCRESPDLLPRVRARLQRLRAVEDEIGALFPGAAPAGGVTPMGRELPRIRGYDVQAVLGCGGMGIVYQAWHLRLNRPVALKMLVAGAHAGPQELERFLREAEAVAGLRHPNIVQVFDVGDLDGRPYFTMEYIEGGSLAQKIAGTPRPAVEAAALVAILAEAIDVAHRGGIIHRDLKPANILLTADGTPRITDFGLARRLGDRDGLTQSGAPIGTPSYMSPEQAEGKRDAIGPATDVYALGAILYELLTGRPPFRADTAPETERQVIAQDPVPPSRLNTHVPRDLETICLKCLQKEPARRYAGAAALAEDLGRFGRGEPIAARPVGSMERGLRWLRRRPTVAVALAVGALLALGSGAVGWRWHLQRSAAVRAAVRDAREDLREAESLERSFQFAMAADTLARARLRLGDDGPEELHDQLARASRDLELMERLDATRLDRELILTLSMRPVVTRGPRDGTALAQKYEEAFRDAALWTDRDDPAAVAARLAASPRRAELVAALDDWASCTADRDRRARLLTVARLADPDAWRDRVRDPATWDDPAALPGLAEAVRVADQPPHLLSMLARRLREKDGDAVAFMQRVVLAHPGDFWANVELAYTVYATDPSEALGYYRTALAIRPKTAPVHGGLGVLQFHQDHLALARDHFQSAAQLAPSATWAHNNLGVTSFAEGRRDEAVAHFREALRLDPDSTAAHGNLALVLEADGRPADALDEARQAIRLEPMGGAVRWDLQGLMLRLGRGDEWRHAWEHELEANPPEHGAWLGYAELCLFLGDEAEYRRARRALFVRFGTSTDPIVAERTARAYLLLPAPDEEVRQVARLLDRAVLAREPMYQPQYPYFQFATGLAEYRLGRFARAFEVMQGPAAKVPGPYPGLVMAMAQHRLGQHDLARKTLAAAIVPFDWSARLAIRRDPHWIAHVLRREAESLILPDLPAFLEGRYRPRDNDERLALLGVCQFKALRGAEAGLYAAAFAADPGLASDLPAGLRHRAARAAAVAGCGGADGAGLGAQERARWRRQARDWLRADVKAWAAHVESNPAADRAQIRQALTAWRADPDLAGLRDPRRLDALPAAEREECRALWNDLATRVERFLTQHGEYRPLPLEKVATIVTTRGMFYDEKNQVERLVFNDWSPKEFEGVPFRLIDPLGEKVPNAILLHGPRGTFPPRMPRSVRIPCNASARAIHFLGGVSGWGYPTSSPGTVSINVRLHYAGGRTEDHPLINGQHFADYIGRVDVPGSLFAFRLRNQQLRYLAIFPHQDDRIEEIELIKGPDDTAPIVMAITVESR